MEIERSDIIDISVLVFFPIFLLLDYFYGLEDIAAVFYWGLILSFFVILGVGVYFARKTKSLNDERFKRIDERAGSNAFWIMMLMFVLGVFRNNPDVGFCIGFFSYYAFRFYYKKIGFK